MSRSPKTAAQIIAQDVSLRKIKLLIPYIPPREAFPRAFEGRHWSARSGIKAKMKQDIMVLAGSGDVRAIVQGRPFERAHITITFRSPKGNYDGDNALAASKGWLDGLVAEKIIRNDTVSRVSYTVKWWRAVVEATTIEVEEIKAVLR